MTEDQQATGLPPEAVEIFARGLYHLAQCDGMEEREERLIREFLEEAGSDIRFEALTDMPFSAVEAAQALEATYLRRIFIKAAVALVKADGVFSDNERHALGEIADAFGMSNAEFGDLEQEAAKTSLE